MQSESDNNQSDIEVSPQVRTGYPMVTRSKSGIIKPKLYTTISLSEEPKTFEQAAKDKH